MKNTKTESKIAIHHRIKSTEGFDRSVEILMSLVREAQERNPGAPRVLYLDIDGHRNDVGGFDQDMFELQSVFMFTVLFDFFSEVYCPLYHACNPAYQKDVIPENLQILPCPKSNTKTSASHRKSSV